MTTQQPSMQVRSGSDYLRQVEDHSRQRKEQMATLVAFLWLATAGLALFQVFFALLFGTSVVPFWVTAVLAVLSAACYPLIGQVDRLEARERDFATGRAGEERLVAFLHKYLGAEWRLFRNVVLLDGKGDIDAVLIGPAGIFALEVKAWNRSFRNQGEEWAYQAGGQWIPMERSPTIQAKWNARRLGKYLKERGIHVPVLPRVVWAGKGRVYLIKPDVPVWNLRSPQFILSDLSGDTRVPSNVREQVANVLGELTG